MQPSFVSTHVSVCLALTVCLSGCADPPTPISQRLIITYWDQPASGGSTNPGVDLDGRVSSGEIDRCDDAPDFERDGALGIDNAYGTILLPLIDGSELGGAERGVAAAVPVQLLSGEGMYGFEVENQTDTGAVFITLLSLTSSTLELDDRLRLRASGVTATPIERVEASNEAGRWRARFASLDLPMGPVLGLRRVTGVVVDFEVLNDGRIARADLGGRVSIETAVAVGVIVNGESDAWTRTILSDLGVADLEPNDDGTVCSAISLGIGLELGQLSF